MLPTWRALLSQKVVTAVARRRMATAPASQLGGKRGGLSANGDGLRPAIEERIRTASARYSDLSQQLNSEEVRLPPCYSSLH